MRKVFQSLAYLGGLQLLLLVNCTPYHRLDLLTRRQVPSSSTLIWILWTWTTRSSMTVSALGSAVADLHKALPKFCRNLRRRHLMMMMMGHSYSLVRVLCFIVCLKSQDPSEATARHLGLSAYTELHSGITDLAFICAYSFRDAPADS